MLDFKDYYKGKKLIKILDRMKNNITNIKDIISDGKKLTEEKLQRFIDKYENGDMIKETKRKV